MKLKEEYQKLNETMQSLTSAQKTQKEIGKKYSEVLIEIYQWLVLDKEELESRLEGVRANLVSSTKAKLGRSNAEK